MIQLIEERKEELVRLCREFGVSKLELFGSAATPEFDAQRSDLDFLVEYPPDYDFGPWLARHQDLEAELAALFDRDVDLIMISALRKEGFRREAEKTRTVLYDAATYANVA